MRFAGTSVANQIRGNLGVNMGGAHGRPLLAHKGVGINRNKGGLNAQGSGKSPLRGAIQNGLKPLPKKGQAGFDAAHNRAPKFPHAKTFTDGSGTVRQIGGKVVTPGTPSPETMTTPTASAPIPTNPLDYRNLSSYQSANADLDMDLSGRRRGIQSQLEANKFAYGRAVADDKAAYARDVESGEDDLNHGGLLRSGVREVADSDRFKEYDRHLADIEAQYGSGATAKLNAALEDLARFEAQQRNAIEAGARDEYSQMYPAAPLAETPAPETPASETPAAKPATPKFLRVYVPNGKGGYKVGSMSTAKMTPAQLKAALASPLNK